MEGGEFSSNMEEASLEDGSVVLANKTRAMEQVERRVAQERRGEQEWRSQNAWTYGTSDHFPSLWQKLSRLVRTLGSRVPSGAI